MEKEIIDELTVRSCYYQMALYGCTAEQCSRAYAPEVVAEALVRIEAEVVKEAAE